MFDRIASAEPQCDRQQDVKRTSCVLPDKHVDRSPNVPTAFRDEQAEPSDMVDCAEL